MTWLRHASHPRLALLLGLFSLAAGCSSDPQTVTLELGSPAPGATLTSSIDEDAGAAGVQVTVRGTSEGLSQGTTINVYIDGEKLEQSAKIDAEGAVAIEDVTLLPGEHSLQLRTSTGSASTDEDNRYTLRALRIVTPEDGVRLTIDADLDTGTEGLQVNVRVESWALDDGEEIALEVDGERVATESPDDEGEVLFAGVTLGDGSHTLQAVAGAGESLTRSDEVALEVDADCARVTFLTPEPPSSGDLLLGGDATCPSGDDPFTIDVEVSTDVGDGQPIAILVNDRVRGSGTVDGTTAVFQDVVLDRRDSPNDISIEVENADGITCVVPYPSEVLVDCAGPDCTLQGPEPRVVNVDGETVSFLNASMQSDGGFDVEVATSAEAVGQSVRLIVDGREREALEQDASESGSGGQADFAAVSVSDGEHTVEARCRDAAGNVTSTGEIAITVDTQACGVSITDPADDTLFIEADDEDGASDGTQVVATSTVSGDDCAEQRAAVCDPGAGIDGVSFASYDGVDPLLSSITLDETSRQQNLCVEIRDHAGNVGADAVPVIYRDAADAPSVLIESPTDGTRFNALGGGGYEADADRVTTGACDADFVVACTEVGELVRLRHDDAMGTVFGSGTCEADDGAPSGYSGRARITAPFGDGDQSATVVATQSTSASSGTDLQGVSAPIVIEGDCQIPQVSFLGNPCRLGQGNQIEVDEAASVSVTVRDATSDIDEATLTVTQADSTVLTPSPTTPGSQETVFDGVDLGGLGTAQLEGRVTDDFDNTETTSCSVEIVADLPSIVSFSEPANDASYGPGDSCDPGVAGEYGIRVLATIDSDSNRSVSILVNDSTVASNVDISGAGVIDECVVVPDNLENDPVGNSTVTLRVESVLGPGMVSQTRSVEVESIRIDAPVADQVLVSDDDCAVSGFGSTVTFSVDAKHDGGSVSLSSSNGGSLAPISVVISSGRSVQVVSGCLQLAADLSEEGPNTITAQVTSEVAVDSVSVLVVDGAPTAGITIDPRSDPAIDDLDHRSGVVASWPQPAADWSGQLVRYEMRCRSSSLSAGASAGDKEQWWSDVIDVDGGAAEPLPVGLTPDDADPSVRLGYRPLQPVHCVVRAFDPAGQATPITESTNLTMRLRQAVAAEGVDDGLLGVEVAAAGDVDGDGIDDIIVGGEGEAALIFGSANGFGGTADVVFSNSASSAVGSAVAGLGDFDGDGLDDFAIGDWSFNSNAGRVTVFLGRVRDAWPATVPLETSGCPGDLCFEGDAANVGIAYTEIDPAGDFDDDGRPDVAISAPYANGTSGLLQIVLGDAYQRRECTDGGDCRAGVEVCDIDPGADPGSQTYCQLDSVDFWGLRYEIPAGTWINAPTGTPEVLRGFQLPFPTSSARFTWSMAPLGQADASAGDDLAIGAQGAGEIHFLSGRPWADAPAARLNVLGLADLGLRDVGGTPDGQPIATATSAGSPLGAVGDVYDLPDAVVSGVPDLGNTGPSTDNMSLYVGDTGDGMSAAPFEEVLTVTAPGTNIGQSFATGFHPGLGELLGDVDGDGAADLCVGTRLSQELFFWYHDVLAGAVSSGSVPPTSASHLPIGAGSCDVSDTTCVPLDADTAELTVEYVGDVNGDGHMDIAVGDRRAGDASAETGRVVVLY